MIQYTQISVESEALSAVIFCEQGSHLIICSSKEFFSKAESILLAHSKKQIYLQSPNAVMLNDWLILHELSHFDLGHFELLGRDEIVEAGEQRSFGLISRDESNSSPLPELVDIDYQLLERCLELQADHEALDIFLNECSHDNVEELRLRIAAASAMMVLIDIEDIKRNSKQTSHPKAATRIFQMLGHVCELPFLPEQVSAIYQDRSIDPDVIPSEEVQQTFVKQVAIPAFYDAIALARAADAEYIVEQLGDLPAFFDDVYLAKTNSDSGTEQFKTQGAKEWCQLKPLNERILAVQRERDLI